jgi:hypothetical protein
MKVNDVLGKWSSKRMDNTEVINVVEWEDYRIKGILIVCVTMVI